VDEVSTDTVTRGALKDDATFKGLRDVIKKGNRVLEDMLVRRERKYTLFFRLVQPHDREEIDRMRSWNGKVEKAVGQVTGERDGENGSSQADGGSSGGLGASSSSLSSSASSSSVGSAMSSSSSVGSTSTGSVSSLSGVFSRGRQLLPTAGRVRSRRATPTPRLRKHRKGDEGSNEAADDGFSASVSIGAA
jgi:hypothetical protein